MATLTIRKLDDDVVERLRSRAKRNRRSLEAEVRHVLAEHSCDPDTMIDRLEAFHREMSEEYGMLSDSTPIIREMREQE